VWFSATCAALLGLITFAGPAAAGALFTLGVVGQYVANSIPIAARWLGGQPFHSGPFNLGIFVGGRITLTLRVLMQIYF
jgi:hypothetical protein